MAHSNILSKINQNLLITVFLFFINSIVSAQTPSCVCAPCACYWYVAQGYDCSITNQTACLPSLCDADFEKCRIACGCKSKGLNGGTSTDNGPFQKNPGDVSIDGMSQGVPFFTGHQSSAFEDWAKEYKAQLESYGIKSIVGNKIKPNTKPLTDDPNWDEKYKNLWGSFNPNPQPNIPDNINKKDKNGVYDLNGNKIADNLNAKVNLKEVGETENSGKPTTNPINTRESSTNFSPEKIEESESPLSTTDIIGLTQTAGDLALEEGTASKLLSGVAGAALGVISYGNDLKDIYSNPDVGMNAKTLYQVSTAVADAGLMVGGIVATSTVIFGVGVVSTPVVIGAAVVMTGAKIYVWYDKPFDK